MIGRFIYRRSAANNRHAISSSFHSSSLCCALSERKSFGSFHSEDVEELIKLPDHEFEAPAVAEAIQSSVLDRHQLTFSNALPVDRLEFRKALFSLEPSATFLNHGAFGATMRPLSFESFLWREYCDSQPLRYYDRELFPLMVRSLRELARLLQTSPTNLFPLPNVTAGLNAICNTFAGILAPGDEVVCFSITYGSTKKILQDLSRRSGCKYKMISLPLPITSKESLLEQIKAQLSESCRLIVIDDITSNTAMQLPSVEIARLCRAVQPNATVVVDAAHSLFARSVALNDADILENVDVWLMNGHKWLSAPKGCGLMWMNPKFTQGIRPAIISHGFQPVNDALTVTRDKALSAFVWDGCRDYSAFLTIPTAIKVWNVLSSAWQPSSSTGASWPPSTKSIIALLTVE